jgi:hypothetical protein
VLEYAPRSAAYEDFQALANWLDEHRPEVQPAEIEIGPAARADRHVVGDGMLPVGEGTQGGRAAELVRRVRQLLHAGPGSSPSPSPTPIPSSGDGATAGVAAATAVETSTAGQLLPATSDPAAAAAAGVRMALSCDAAAPSGAAIRSLVEEIAAEGRSSTGSMSHLYGVRPTTQGVLFVQPGTTGRTVAVAGDFNSWSTLADPLRYDEQLEVFQALVPIPQGIHQYRLVVDGRWQPDPYNARQQLNTYGEANSVLVVDPADREPWRVSRIHWTSWPPCSSPMRIDRWRPGSPQRP